MTLHAVTLAGSLDLPFLRAEKDAALRTLTEDSVFTPLHAPVPGPYGLTLGMADGRLVMEIRGANDEPLPALVLSVRPYSRLVRDYFMMIESYEAMRASGTPCQLEPIDMARRGLHNEGADLLIERLAGKVEMDHATARRLFTLICILHGKHVPLI